VEAFRKMIVDAVPYWEYLYAYKKGNQ